MASLQSAELLGVGVAAILASIFWGHSAWVRALLVAVAGVAALEGLGPLWRMPARGKRMDEDHPPAKQSPSLMVAKIAALAESFSTTVTLQVLTGCLAALPALWIVKALSIPGYPWNGLLLGLFLSGCLHYSGLTEQVCDHEICPCGEHDINDAACPYHADFWVDLEKTTDSNDEDSAIEEPAYFHIGDGVSPWPL
mmetsp:Transcript_30001/g.54904  ORF Transcript_30001/g.54904 Transcript_30001/m.54904 type:complete len:196 (-) Transcript_30001:36-623(-)